ncbi:hypothetical protein [Nocardiopsis quinghaiensis]|uniref:hypothetical protein n=1 Tax=Nocardiopsis quinghaiensis TaxID=464995 RepID=UPI00374252DB
MLSVLPGAEHGLLRRLRAAALRVRGDGSALPSVLRHGWEDWLLANPGSPDADEVRAGADRHREFRVRGTRETIGFAYLSLIRV